jgi:uncharacterized Zn finger protein (UPF0148 family)
VPAAGISYRGPACPHCRRPLEHHLLLSGRQACPVCNREFEAVRFDPPPRPVVRAAPAAGGEEHACPAHRGNAVATSCERCGVFLCALCRIEVEGQVLCPACFTRLSAEGELVLARNRFRDHDGVASLLVLCGFVLGPVGIVTGPAAVYFAVRGRRQRLAWGDTPATGRVVTVAVLGLLNVALSVGLMAFLFTA